MNFIDEYKQWLERCGGITQAVAKSRAVHMGEDKKLTIETAPYNGKRLLTGNFYILNHTNPILYKNVKEGVEKAPSYYETHPIVLSIGNEGEFETCLNLNVLFMPNRLRLFNFIFKGFERIVNDNLSLDVDKRKKIPFNKSNAKSVAGLSSDLAVYYYERKFINNIAAVDWNSMVMLSTLYTVESLMFNPNSKLNIKKLQAAASK